MTADQQSVLESTGYWITRLARSMERDFERRLEAVGITRGAFAVLSAIHVDKKSTPAELAAFLGVDGAAITRHLDRIEKKGLIERTHSSTDRRSINLALTNSGRRAVRQGRAHSKATNERFTSGVTSAEIERLQSMIQVMLSNSDGAVADI